jgi:hypothetical protein
MEPRLEALFPIVGPTVAVSEGEDLDCHQLFPIDNSVRKSSENVLSRAEFA